MRNQEASDMPQLVNFAAPQVVIKQSVKKTFLQPFIIWKYIFLPSSWPKMTSSESFCVEELKEQKIDRG